MLCECCGTRKDRGDTKSRRTSPKVGHRRGREVRTELLPNSGRVVEVPSLGKGNRLGGVATPSLHKGEIPKDPEGSVTSPAAGHLVRVASRSTSTIKPATTMTGPAKAECIRENGTLTPIQLVRKEMPVCQLCASGTKEGDAVFPKDPAHENTGTTL